MRKLAVEILCEIKDENSNSTNLLNKSTKNISDLDSKFLREIVYELWKTEFILII